MKKLILTFLFLLICSTAMAKTYWVLIVKKDGSVGLDFEKGDVIRIDPVDVAHEPTRAEKETYTVIQMEFDDEKKIKDLLEWDRAGSETNKLRKQKIDLEKITKESYTKNEIDDKIIIKSAIAGDPVNP